MCTSVLENFKDEWNPLRSLDRRWPECGMVLRFFAQLVKNRAMFFVLSKTLAVFLEPLVHPLLGLLLGRLAQWRRRQRLARFCYGFAITLPLLYGFIPLSSMPLRVLENQFPVPTLVATQPIDGIIVLGGHTADGVIAESRTQPQQNGRADRLTNGVALHRQFPEALLLFTGFSGKLQHAGWNEAKITGALIDMLGAPQDNILFETTSRNTYENAVNSKAVLVPQPGSRWLLVTSASHMPRSIGTFRAAGWTGLIPYPVDYQTATTAHKWYSLKDGMQLMRRSLYEYVGLLMYRVTGRSCDLLPKPPSP